MTDRLTITDPPVADPSKPPEGIEGDKDGVTLPPDASTQSPEGDPPTGEKGGDPPERPDWLPEKFKTPEDMAKAYAELEGKLGTGGTKETEGAAEGTAEAALESSGVSMETVNRELLQDGELSKETISAFEKAGINKDTIDSIVAGQQALSEKIVSGVHEIAGGPEGYNAMLKWAQANLPKEQAEAFDRAVTSGDMEFTRLAVQGLKATYDAANGTDPKLVSPDAPAVGGIEPYGSNEELVRDMGNSLYKTDPAYRDKVHKRLKVSKLW